jgi:hypothetical protein
MIKVILGFFLLLFTFCRCSTIRDTPKYEFANGYYTTKLFGGGSKDVFVTNEEESVLIYPLRKVGKTFVVDTTQHKRLALPQVFSDSLLGLQVFRRKSFDIDFLTIPFKYRPRVNAFARQFNTNLNGGVYLGYRNDNYVLQYRKDVLGRFQRKTTHLGFSFGAFTGVGGTAMNPWVTNDQINIEYDGVVWTKGVTGIIGLDKFTVGLAVGWDNLMDRNKRHWIYQGKPWIGLAFGLNLN